MATIGVEGKGRRLRRRILFVAPDGKRKTIRLGKCSESDAIHVKGRVEKLVTAAILGNAPDDDTARWLASRDDELYNRLAAVGLCIKRADGKLGPWTESYINDRSPELKPRTLNTLRATRRHLVKFFGDDCPMRSITREQASKWRAKMLEDGRALASVRLDAGNARQFFGEAVRRDLVRHNVFDHLPAGSTPSTNDRYITADEAHRIVEACGTDTRTKVLFCLARYAGLRIPSESEPLTWGHVDFGRGRLRVQSIKTARYQGKGWRTVPIDPRLAKVLQEAFTAAPEGSQKIVEHRSNEYTRKRVMAAIIRAGIEPWADPFRVLRNSCEKELATTNPQFAVSQWMGHSIQISGKHYANSVPDELFDRVVSAAQKAAHSAHAETRTDAPTNGSPNQKPAENPEFCSVGHGEARGCADDAKTANFDPSNRRS